MSQKKNKDELIKTLKSFDISLWKILNDAHSLSDRKIKIYIAGASSLLINDLLERKKTRDIDYTSPNLSKVKKIQSQLEELRRIYDLEDISMYDSLIYHFEQELIPLRENNLFSILEVYTLSIELSVLMKIDSARNRWELDYYDISNELIFKRIDIKKLESMLKEVTDDNLIIGHDEYKYRHMWDIFNSFVREYKKYKKEKKA